MLLDVTAHIAAESEFTGGVGPDWLNLAEAEA